MLTHGQLLISSEAPKLFSVEALALGARLQRQQVAVSEAPGRGGGGSPFSDPRLFRFFEASVLSQFLIFQSTPFGFAHTGFGLEKQGLPPPPPHLEGSVVFGLFGPSRSGKVSTV